MTCIVRMSDMVSFNEITQARAVLFLVPSQFYTGDTDAKQVYKLYHKFAYMSQYVDGEYSWNATLMEHSLKCVCVLQ